MTTLEQIRALAAQGIGRKAVEATIGRAMSDEELDAWRKADTVRRLKIAAKKAKGPVRRGPRGEARQRAQRGGRNPAASPSTPERAVPV